MRDKYKKYLTFSSIFFGIILASSSLLTSQAAAFSGYGEGSSDTPFLIGTCSQLEEISSNLSASYHLVRNIDCSGTTMTPIGDSSTPFTGSLNGQGFSIENVTMSVGNNDVGLFGATDTANIADLTIKNSSINGNNNVGALIGVDMDSSTVSDVRTDNVTVNGANYVGGIVGNMGGTYLTDSSSINGDVGNISADNIGGIAGYSLGPVLITNTYTSNTVRGNNYVGGFIGYIGSGAALISDIYANAQMYDGGNYVGGLVGDATSSDTLITYAFTTSNPVIGDSGMDGGAVFGASSATTSNIRFDESLTVNNECAGEGSPSDCVAVDTDGSDPTYFQNTHSVVPLSSWDFNNTWVQNQNDFPSLTPLTNSFTTNAPNGNDANGDGIDDSYEPNVNSVESNSNVWSTVTVPSSTGCIVQDPLSSDPSTTDSYQNALGSLTGFTLYCPTPGMSVPVTIIYDKQYNTADWILRYFNVNSNAYETVNNAVFGTVTIDGTVKTTVTYTVTDGGSYDSDGSANGVIVDPVVPAINPAVNSKSAPATGYGQVSHNTSYVIALPFLFSLILGIGLARRTSRKVQD